MSEVSGTEGAGDEHNPPVVRGELTLTAERWAFLAPRFEALLDDFRKLEQIAAPDSEPAMNAELSEGNRHDGD